MTLKQQLAGSEAIMDDEDISSSKVSVALNVSSVENLVSISIDHTLLQ